MPRGKPMKLSPKAQRALDAQKPKPEPPVNRKPIQKPPRKQRVAEVVPDDIQFGLNWTKGGYHNVPEIMKRLSCARYRAGTTSLFEHRKEIIKFGWPHYSWHYWLEDRLMDFCEHNFTSWMGCGSSGKTQDAAISALEYWLEAPHETAVMVCSTTKDMLRSRIWGSIVELFGQMNPELRKYIFPEGYGELLDASCFIRWTDGDWKNGIKGIAVQDGPVQEAINNIIGIHTKRVFVILDEAQGVREAIMGAIPNLLKNPESKMHIMGNPSDYNSLLCRYSEPLGGWKSIQRFQYTWEIDAQGYGGVGRCRFFDGRKSPAVLDPEWAKANTWCINQEKINNHLWSKKIAGNENHPDFMWQTIGWPPEKGLEETVLDASIVNRFLLREKPIWTDRTIDFASLDPAFGGGDDPVLQIMRRGLVREPEQEERWVIAGLEEIIVPINADSEQPVEYQIVEFVKETCKARGIPPSELAVASAGRGAALKAIFDIEWGQVNGIEESGSPSERIVDEKGRMAKEFYNTRASEICMGIRDFALGNCLRNVPEAVITQACARYTFTLNGKFCAEPKTATKGLIAAKGTGAKGFKERMGYSPDESDSWNIGLAHARMKGADSGFGFSAPKKTMTWEKEVRQSSNEYSESNYTEVNDWKYESEYVEILLP